MLKGCSIRKVEAIGLGDQTQVIRLAGARAFPCWATRVTVTFTVGMTQKPSPAHKHWQLLSYFDFRSHLCLALFCDLWLKFSITVTLFLTVHWLCYFCEETERNSRALLPHPFWSLNRRILGSLQQRSVRRWPPGLLDTSLL